MVLREQLSIISEDCPVRIFANGHLIAESHQMDSEESIRASKYVFYNYQIQLFLDKKVISVSWDNTGIRIDVDTDGIEMGIFVK